jgi:hypothetical protein
LQRNWECFFAPIFVHDHRTDGARGLLNLLWDLIAQGLVWAFGVVKVKVFRQTYQQLDHRGVAVEVHVFVFHAPLKQFHKDVVASPTPAVHADGNGLSFQNVHEGNAGELAPRVAAEHLGLAMFAQGVFQAVHSKRCVHAVTDSPAPDGQSKFPHPWPPQIPPGSAARLLRFRLDGQASSRLLEPVALALKLQHHAAVHQPVQNRAGHRRISQILAPVLHHPVRCHHQGVAQLVALVDNGLQHFCRLRRDPPGQKQIVYDQQIRLELLFEHVRPVLAARQRIPRKLGIRLQIPHVIALQRGLVRQRLGHMAVACARFAHNQCISPLGDELQGVQLKTRSAGYLSMRPVKPY